MSAKTTDEIANVTKAMDRLMDDGVVLEARIVVPSLEIYLKYAETVGATVVAE
jgi:hypothetical protein